ncbi:MAG: RidA family protein [Acidimicrobiales bacterium]|nr:RidA family protein [Acidimicrobiales bacterium]
MAELVTPRGRFPHLRRVGNLVFVSGTSSRRADNSIAGAEVDSAGTMSLDIARQTREVLENIERILETVDLDRSDLVDVTSFLVNMNDFGPYNEEWARFFEGHVAPARTTVAVHQLPHPHLLVEMKATAAFTSEES